ncbi:MAG: hypothetical protein JEZ02_18925 [Desulfatibacillum sp.]|nr:hypothetical protein [Desulfatibacillum sp.]
MKRIFTIAAVFAMVAALSAPALAETKFSFKGQYRVRGFMLSNTSLQADQAAAKATGTPGTSSATPAIAEEGEGPSQSWMDMRFRMESKFTVSERLSVVTRFDALDNKKYGMDDNDTTGGACPSRNNNIDFDRAYMVIATDFGKFQAGSMAGGQYGTKFLDTEKERDRVRFDTKMDKWILSLVYEKQKEVDSDDCKGTDVLSDADYDIYYAAATYKSEGLSGGLLIGYGTDKSKSDILAYVPAANKLGYDSTLMVFNPYIKAGFGDFGINAEGQILFGKYKEYDRDVYSESVKLADIARKAAGLGPLADIDYDAYAWNMEGTWASGPFTAEVGYVWVKGEEDVNDDKMESLGGIGNDWGKVFILTNTDSGFEKTLGGHSGAAAAGAAAGNLSSGSTAALNGCKLFYLGGSYSPLENLKISALLANSKSESPGYVGYSAGTLKKDSRSFASDHGSEYDLTIDWDIYDNLNYTAILAYLDAGDYWQFGNPYRELENTWCFWQQLKLSF